MAQTNPMVRDPATPTASSIHHAHLLVIDDEVEMCAWLALGLSKLGFQVSTCNTAEQALLSLEKAPFDVVITDLHLQGSTGTELCERIVEGNPDIPVVVLTAFGSLDSAVAAIRAGAYDFITKPVELAVLQLSVERAIRHRRMHDEVRRLRSTATTHQLADLIGQSEAMQRVHDTLLRIAETDTSVLITGESGTGKEVVAHALHRVSRRAGGPFVALNCAALPETLLESELFGHERGAFTDARTARTGLLVSANGGTLLLDEIGDMPLALQPKLLRVLQERKVRPLGGEREVPIDVRIVTATHHDLEAAVAERTFREDLYYRIAVIHVALPPLRTRGTDVLLLAQSFIEQHAKRMGRTVQGLSPAAAERLMAYDFPGNVRELQNVIERAVALARYDEITMEDLSPKILARRKGTPVTPASDEELVPLEQVERRHVLRVLTAVGGNKTLAAQVLGLDRKTVHRRLEAWGRQGSLE